MATLTDAERIVEEVVRMQPGARTELLDALRDRFCPYCGEDYRDASRACYCTYDD